MRDGKKLTVDSPRLTVKTKPRQDFVRFRLRVEAPDYVAFGGARFSGVFARAQEPFEVTRGEWKVFFERTGFFEEEPEIRSQNPVRLKAEG
jgi:hypothetical protein